MYRGLRYFFTAVVMIFFVGEAQSATPDKAVICETCTSYEQYYSEAIRATNFGVVAIFNYENEEVKTYHVSYEPEIGGYIVEEFPNHPDTVRVLNVAVELKTSFEQYNLTNSNLNSFDPNWQSHNSTADNQLGAKDKGGNYFLNSAGNGCGIEGSWTNSQYTQMPFQAACNAHDTCYESTNSKSFCDAKFLSDMLWIAKDISEDVLDDEGLAGVLQQIAAALVEKIIQAQASAYYLAVLGDDGLEAYCGATTNASPPECYPDIDPRDILGGDNKTYEGNDSFGFFKINCDILILPDGNGGYAAYEVDCDIIALP